MPQIYLVCDKKKQTFLGSSDGYFSKQSRKNKFYACQRLALLHFLFKFNPLLTNPEILMTLITSLPYKTLKKIAFENITGKWRKCWHYLFFPLCLLPYLDQISVLSPIFVVCSCFNLDKPKFCRKFCLLIKSQQSF